MKLISACLLGIKCEWDGKDRHKNDKAIELLKNETLIPVCPEQLGGLKTPRAPQGIRRGTGADVLDKKCKVINENGENVTQEFIRGAEETLKIANLFHIKEFIGKSNSPSCGYGKVYDTTGKLIDGDGVTTALLKRNGIRIIREEDLHYLTYDKRF
jgi:uncharacterized protein YbbK (DUF523 family)